VVLSAEGEGFVPPSSNDFELPPIFGDNVFTTKPIFLVFLSVILVSVFFILSSRKASIVPSKFQFAGESIYAFVRNDLARDVIGHDFMRFVPYLFTLFTFILTNNIFGIVPFLQFPTMSRVSFPYVLAASVYLVFHYVGIRKQGAWKYFKEIMFMPGVPKAADILTCSPTNSFTSFVCEYVCRSLAPARLYPGWRTSPPRCYWFEVNQSVCLLYRHRSDFL
jgi:F-type H+-transporting ATPase subunit a